MVGVKSLVVCTAVLSAPVLAAGAKCKVTGADKCKAAETTCPLDGQMCVYQGKGSAKTLACMDEATAKVAMEAAKKAGTGIHECTDSGKDDCSCTVKSGTTIAHMPADAHKIGAAGAVASLLVALFL